MIKEARRAPGSEWFKDHPRLLESLYQGMMALFLAVYPTFKRVSPGLMLKVMVWSEKVFKGYLFNCQMCGQCILHSTGMTCPMTCPKNLRDGPCGGVRANGHCEVIPERPCVWVQGWQRSRQMKLYRAEIQIIQPPVNHALADTSSWINMAEGVDRQPPPGWEPPPRGDVT